MLLQQVHEQMGGRKAANIAQGTFVALGHFVITAEWLAAEVQLILRIGIVHTHRMVVAMLRRRRQMVGIEALAAQSVFRAEPAGVAAALEIGYLAVLAAVAKVALRRIAHLVGHGCLK